jgi:hypothetical protein
VLELPEHAVPRLPGVGSMRVSLRASSPYLSVVHLSISMCCCVCWTVYPYDTMLYCSADIFSYLVYILDWVSVHLRLRTVTVRLSEVSISDCTIYGLYL